MPHYDYPGPAVGWKTSLEHFRDDAVWGGPDNWNPLFDPITGETLDLAFVITTCEDNTPPIITKTHPESEEEYLYDPDAEIGVDVLFIFDLSYSMFDDMADVKTSAIDIMDEIRISNPDSAFGVVTFVDYNGQYGGCGYGNTYGSGADYPYLLDKNITTDTGEVSTIINGMPIYNGEDWPQDYSRVLYESLHDSEIGWRNCTKRVVIVFGDAPTHDCDFYSTSTGVDPGRDAIAGNEDDLDFETVVAELAAYDMTVMSVDCPGSGGDDAQESFEYMAAQTGGEYYPLADATDAASDIVDLAKGKAYIKPYAIITLDAEDPLVPPCTSGFESMFWRYEYEGVSYPVEDDGDGAINGTELEALYGYTDPMITGYWWYVNDTGHVEIYFEEDCLHTLYYWAKDNSCNPTPIHKQKYYVDGTGPVQTVEFGNPYEIYHWGSEDYYVVGPYTPIRIKSDDAKVGSKELHYYIQYGPTFQQCPYVSVGPKTVYDGGGDPSDPYTYDITPPGDGIIEVEIYEDESCWHQVHYYCVDKFNNRQPEVGEYWYDFIVDADAPTYQVEFEGPVFLDPEGWLWMGECTKKWINVTDIGCTDYYIAGADKVDWYIHKVILPNTYVPWLSGTVYDWDGAGPPPTGSLVDLNPVDGEINFWINVPEDCYHYICWRVYDDLGNYDVDLGIPTPNKQKHRVDVTHPISELGITGNQCPKDVDEYCVTMSTLISISTTNVGVEPCIYPEYWTFFRIYVEDEGKWYPDNGDYAGFSAATKQFWKDKWWFAYQDTPLIEFYFQEECYHILEFFVKDPLCNTEETHVYYFWVDEQAPVIIKTIHPPNYATCVTCTNDLFNPGFETGDFTPGWTIDAVTDSVTVVTADGFTLPYTGTYMARLGDDNGGGSQPIGPNQISQIFTVNQNTFAFAYNIFTYDWEGFNHFEYKLETADGTTTIAYYSQVIILTLYGGIQIVNYPRGRLQKIFHPLISLWGYSPDVPSFHIKSSLLW